MSDKRFDLGKLLGTEAGGVPEEARDFIRALIEGRVSAYSLAWAGRGADEGKVYTRNEIDLDGIDTPGGWVMLLGMIAMLQSRAQARLLEHWRDDSDEGTDDDGG